MKKIKVVTLVGSFRKESYNRKLAYAIEGSASSNIEFEYPEFEHLPLFNADLESDFPEEAQELKDQIDDADAVLIVSPEYNHGTPGGLKNAIDWISRPGNGSGTSFAGKPAAIAGASTGRIGTARMQVEMRKTFASQNMIDMKKPEILMAQAQKFFDNEGNIQAPFDSLVGDFMESFEKWISDHTDHED